MASTTSWKLELTSFDIFVNDARFAPRDFFARFQLPSDGGQTMTHIFASAAAGVLRRAGVPTRSGSAHPTGAAVLRGSLEEGSFEHRFWRTYQKGETDRLHQGVGTQNGPRYTLRFCRAFDGAHLAKRSERGGWRIGIGPEVIAGEIDMLPTER